ncbi:MAG: serine/threonine protein kinase, partial [Myxococcales bacterium]|nr:serine/threonine protein kinase [Myxococcales bacterium]
MTDDPRIDQTLDGRYVLRRRIGKGGMGVVYEAEHLALERRVAVKLIAPHEAAAAPSGFVERFRREARLASRIAHEHLVHIYDVGTHEGSEYLVMELVVGRDLRDELVAGALSFARAASIMRQLLSALAAIHDAGIVHRDIKPANVMLTTHGDERDYVKLMDFGIARGLEDTNLTKTGHVVGTASFMAPEQLRGKPVDHRSDLYAAGVTLFAMLAGRLPFDGNTAEVAGAHVFQAPPSLLALRPGTPPALAAVVERALAKSPDDRFADARAFAAALASAIEAPVAARAPDRVATAVERPVPPARTSSRGRGLVAIAVAAAAALGGVAGFVARGTAGREATPAPATALPSAPPPPTRPPAETVAAAAVEP